MRQADIVFALCLLVLAGLVAWESLALNIGWGINGPEGGFFPFWLAVGLGLCSLVILGQAVWRAAPAAQATRGVRRVGTPVDGRPTSHRHGRPLCMHWPLPSNRPLSGFLHAMGWSAPLALVLAVSICLPLGSYFLFDKWFLIPMPKGLWGSISASSAQEQTVDAFTNLIMGFQIALSPYNLMIATAGIILGTIIGVLPGLGGANGVAILLPVTFVMPHTSGIILLSCIWGALFGGAITSILFNIPGEPWSVATTFDGHPMAKRGLGGQALTAAFMSSFIGAAFAIILVTFFAPLIAEFSLHFGPPEFLGIQLLTFSAFVGLGGVSPVKTIASILVGFLLGAVGMDIVSGQLRLTFGTVELMRGFSFVVAVIGLFGIGEIFLTVEEGLAFRGRKHS